MPASPITKEITLPDNWVHLQKTMMPDQTTAAYWSVWYDPLQNSKGKAWLMWCPFGQDPSVNDNWGHAEEIDSSCRDLLYTIGAVFGVCFLDEMWFPMTATEGKIEVTSE